MYASSGVGTPNKWVADLTRVGQGGCCQSLGPSGSAPSSFSSYPVSSIADEKVEVSRMVSRKHSPQAQGRSPGPCKEGIVPRNVFSELGKETQAPSGVAIGWVKE